MSAAPAAVVRWSGGAYLLLSVAIISEVVATLSLKAAVSHPAFYLLAAAGYAVVFPLLVAVLRRLPLSVTYGVWGAVGVAATAILSSLLFQESLTARKVLGLAVVIVGLTVLQVGSARASRAGRGEN